MITEIENFLSDKECDVLIQMIESNHTRSSVVEGGNNISVVSENRTSSTTNLNHQDKFVKDIHLKIAEYLGEPLLKGEHLQGQLYEKDQYFRPHNDFFVGTAYDKHCLSSGNRTYTLMIYLNDDFEGGATNFPKLNKTIIPKKGKAIKWLNTIESIGQIETLHEGQPIINGNKFIITSWWRENDWNGSEDTSKFLNMKKTYTNIEQIPKFTENGFKVIKCPKNVWGYIQDAYNLLKDKKTEEVFDNKENVIIGGGSDILSFDNLPNIRELIHKELMPLHQEFCGAKIEPSFIYGIRSYLKGATLINHVDRVETHHISSIIIVDKDLRCGCAHKDFSDDWPLDIKDHKGVWQKVYAEIGDMIIYESAICEHGRQEPFGGEYFRNFFIHYKLI
jgi:prolyl 4-hydroxylase